ERYSKTCYFSRQVSFVSKNPLPLGMGSMSKETFNILDNIYNINDMENGILTKLFNKKCIRIFSSAFFYIIIL
ncbi:hypothetical protein, partial [Megamonas funiformis]|uniref:hypothetical protein n=1 Tax=Megamonas funiformis TaxID=437897 RepID=UPI002671695E